MLDDQQRAFAFLPLNRREGKPRKRGLTEIRGPYYSAMGRRYLDDVLDTMGVYVDALKFAGGSFALMPDRALREIIDCCHAHNVLVSTGGFIERVLTYGGDMVDRYLGECQEVGFDIVELSSGFITIPVEDMVKLTKKVNSLGLRAKPEIGIQFGAGGASSVADLEAEGVSDPRRAVDAARRHLDAGAYILMIESEGITEQVNTWRTDVVAQFVADLGLQNVMFEAADPPVFGWYIKNFGPEVNLFVDHSQIVQLESLRSGTWGTKDIWGRVVTYKG
ncbi:MAG: phosphosulfolactate synthase [Chloroflexota bacterium]